MTGPASEQVRMDPPADERDSIELAPEFVDGIREALAEARIDAVQELAGTRHTADLAQLLGLLSQDERRLFIEAMRGLLDPEVLTEVDEAVRDEIVDQLGPVDLAAIVTELDTDDAVYLLSGLDQPEQRAVLQELPPPERMAIEEGLAYGEYTAGRLMRRELVAVPEFWTVGQTIDHLREAQDVPDSFHEIIAVDPAFRVAGIIALDRVLRARREVAIGEIMEREHTPIPVDMDQEQVALLFSKYGLLSAPVVNAGGRLVGVITVDDVVDVISEEAEEDLLRLGGVGDTHIHESVPAISRARVPWLAVNLGTAFLSAAVIAQFGASIEKLVALAVLMPIVASMGGNAGTQALTVTVRTLATRELTAANTMRIIGKELQVAVINGVLFAVLLAAATWLWFGNLLLAGVIAMAIAITMLVAGLSGILIPLTLRRLRADPAVASPVFLTTMTDVVGFLAFLGLATLLLM